MSKPVRLPDYLHAEVEKLAAKEKRSTANMVRVLLEQSLRLEAGGALRIMDGDEPVGIVMPEATPQNSKPKKRLHPCRHHVPPSRVCEYCDV